MKNLGDKFKSAAPVIQLVIVIIAIAALYFIYKKVNEFMNRPRLANVNNSNIPIIGIQNGQQVVWNPDPLAREISENFEGYNFRTYPDTAQKILDLQTDDQVKLLYNHYNTTYAKDYPTLTKLFINEFSDWGGVYAKVVTRLKGLGLQ